MVVNCEVSTLGAFGRTERFHCNASSLFEAAELAYRHWCSVWWWNGNEGTLTVRAGEREWTVSRARIGTYHREVVRPWIKRDPDSGS